MRIQNGQPKYLQLNVHTFGALYEYDNQTETFFIVSGEDHVIGDIHLPVDYPDTVFTVDGHPEIFVSNGSHGNWASPGTDLELQLTISSSFRPTQILAVGYSSGRLHRSGQEMAIL